MGEKFKKFIGKDKIAQVLNVLGIVAMGVGVIAALVILCSDDGGITMFTAFITLVASIVGAFIVFFTPARIINYLKEISEK